MSQLRRCDRRTCEVTRADDPPGIAGFTSFVLNGRNVDLCPACAKVLTRWFFEAGNFVDVELPEIVPIRRDA